MSEMLGKNAVRISKNIYMITTQYKGYVQRKIGVGRRNWHMSEILFNKLWVDIQAKKCTNVLSNLGKYMC